MRESLFWEAIAVARGQPASLYRMLIECPEKAIVAFARIQRRKMRRLYTPDLAAAHFIINGYTSDDSFEDFAAWIVSRGKKAFDAVRKSPDHLAKILEKKDVDRMNGEDFLLLPAQAYAARTSTDDFSRQVDAPAWPRVRVKWPESRKEFEARYPVLYRKFWNQERIREIHSG